MVDSTLIQARMDAGYSKAASVLGQVYQQYRAVDPLHPLSNPLASLSMWATTDPALKGAAPPIFGKPQWFAAIERNGLNVGDYLVGTLGTFFVSSLAYPSPVGLILCNKTISIARLQDNFVPGDNAVRFGSSLQNVAEFMSAWPACVMQLGGGEKMSPTGFNLPTDAKLPGVEIILPASSAPIRFNDLITDENGQRYMVASVESTALGWRLTAELQPAG